MDARAPRSLPRAARLKLARLAALGRATVLLAAPLGASVAVAGLLLGALIGRSALRDEEFGAFAKVSLAAGEIVLSAVVGLVVAACILGVRWLSGRLDGVGRRSLRAAAVIVAWFGVLAYATSWALFWAFGGFLDQSALAFAADTGKLLVKHALETNPVLLSALPLVALGVVALGRRALVRLEARASARGKRVVAWSFAGVLLAGTLLAGAGELGIAGSFEMVHDRILGARLSLGRAFRTARSHRSGPLSHLALAGLSERALGPSIASEAITQGRIQIVERPQVDLDRWIAGIDRSKIRRLNVVVVLYESSQPSTLRSFGGKTLVMPALDALAEKSARFSMYAQAPQSNYAQPTILSSEYPLRDPVHHTYPDHPGYPRVLMYDILKKLGWRTALISSQNEFWGNMHAFFDTGGLDYFFHSESFKGATIPDEDPGFAAWAKNWGHSGKLDDKITMDEAIRWIDRDSTQPFFVYINLQNSHFPYSTPDDFPKRFQPYKIDFPYAFGNYPPDKVNVVKNRWYNALSYVDSQIGRLVQHLKETKTLDHTLLLISADHGEAFYEHGFVCHASAIYNEAVRVPAVLYGPGVEPGSYPALSQAVNVAPTVLGRLGLPPHPAFQGRDLLSGPPDPNRSAYIISQTPISHQTALVHGGWKLIYDYFYESYLLFDLVHDPGEQHDRANEEPGRLRVLAAELHAWENAQLDYYASPARWHSTYPPVLTRRR